MIPQTTGIHHVTAISGEPQRNVDFYAGTLGLKLVKKTVNFDDPETYHLYYGDGAGSPGTIMTFFPWAHAPGAHRVGPARRYLVLHPRRLSRLLDRAPDREGRPLRETARPLRRHDPLFRGPRSSAHRARRRR
jgi:catechol 2,3-dioxygenase-like lactoylglutathione lyase family enzyme